jgi:hypothetical protein
MLASLSRAAVRVAVLPVPPRRRVVIVSLGRSEYDDTGVGMKCDR